MVCCSGFFVTSVLKMSMPGLCLINVNEARRVNLLSI